MAEEDQTTRKSKVRRVQDMGIADANKGNAVVGVERNFGIAASIGGDRHVGDVMEAISPSRRSCRDEIVDVIVSVTGREYEGISAGCHSTGRGSGDAATPLMNWASPHMWSVPVPLISMSLLPRALPDMEKASPKRLLIGAAPPITRTRPAAAPAIM
jgi:hypothetical protein